METMTVKALVNIISREPRAFKQAAAKVSYNANVDMETLSSDFKTQNHIIYPELLYLQTFICEFSRKVLKRLIFTTTIKIQRLS